MSGHEVRLAHDGASALAAARELRPDLVLLDIGLPGMNGYEVAKRLRAEASGRSMRIVAVSGYGGAEDRERAKAAGFDAHLVKPVELMALELELAALPADCEKSKAADCGA
jgi:CheY-like chemotaxis protein